MHTWFHAQLKQKKSVAVSSMYSSLERMSINQRTFRRKFVGYLLIRVFKRTILTRICFFEVIITSLEESQGQTKSQPNARLVQFILVKSIVSKNNQRLSDAGPQEGLKIRGGGSNNVVGIIWPPPTLVEIKLIDMSELGEVGHVPPPPPPASDIPDGNSERHV